MPTPTNRICDICDKFARTPGGTFPAPRKMSQMSLMRVGYPYDFSFDNSQIQPRGLFSMTRARISDNCDKTPQPCWVSWASSRRPLACLASGLRIPFTDSQPAQRRWHKRHEKSTARANVPPGGTHSRLASLDWARHQQAKSWELRTSISLARLWQRQGKRQDAYELLAPVYGCSPKALTPRICKTRRLFSPNWGSRTRRGSNGRDAPRPRPASARISA
jgi:hypothetical protein